MSVNLFGLNIINLLLHNYYGNSNLIYSAYILFINTIFSFCTALLPSIAIRIRTQEMRRLYGELVGVNRIVNKPYIVFNNELGLI